MSLLVRIKSAGYRKRQVLADLDFCVPDGSVTAVIGRNGSGKSTLVACIASLMPFDGKITVDGRELSRMDARERATHVSVLLQELGRPHITVEELVAFGRYPYRSRGRSEHALRSERVQAAITEAELLPLKEAYVDRLSGGEVRRAYFGAVLAQDTPTILLDEATAFMDADHEQRLLRSSRALSEKGKRVICVMHDLACAVRYADHILLLDGGRQRFFGETAALLATDLIEQSFSVRRYEADGTVFFAAR